MRFFKFVTFITFLSCASQESIDFENAKSRDKAINKSLATGVPKMRKCWIKELKEYENVKDSAFVFIIDVAGIDGSVQKVKITNKKKAPDKLMTCLKKSIYDTKFPKKSDGENYSVKQPINFFPLSK